MFNINLKEEKKSMNLVKLLRKKLIWVVAVGDEAIKS